jgi:hypothetical protein
LEITNAPDISSDRILDLEKEDSEFLEDLYRVIDDEALKHSLMMKPSSTLTMI